MDAIRNAIRDIPDFPKQGIVFKDITPILQNKELFSHVIDTLTERYRNRGIDKIAAMESRGFIFGAPLATALGAGFIPLRKPGKLPYKTLSEDFELEYGTETLEMHEDAIGRRERVLLIDDVLATGGTAEASVKLVRRAGGEIVEAAFVIELGFLGGRKRLTDVEIYTMLSFD